MHRSCRGNVPWYLNGTVRVRHALQQRGLVGIGLYVAWRGFHLACVARHLLLERDGATRTCRRRPSWAGLWPLGIQCGLRAWGPVRKSLAQLNADRAVVALVQ